MNIEDLIKDHAEHFGFSDQFVSKLTSVFWAAVDEKTANLEEENALLRHQLALLVTENEKHASQMHRYSTTLSYLGRN
jgi:hypothetical protein